MQIKEFLGKIFSINNELTHICITILGVKMKFRLNPLETINFNWLNGRLTMQNEAIANLRNEIDSGLTMQNEAIANLRNGIDSIINSISYDLTRNIQRSINSVLLHQKTFGEFKNIFSCFCFNNIF